MDYVYILGLEVHKDIVVAIISAGIPSGIAWLIFKKWGNQKGTEVVANESKQAIKDILEVIKIMNFIEFERYDLKEYEKQFNRLKAIFEFSVVSILFIDDCVIVNDLKGRFGEFAKITNEYIHLKDRNALNYNNQDFKDELKSKVVIAGKKGIDVVNKLRPIAIYDKKIKLKKTRNNHY